MRKSLYLKFILGYVLFAMLSFTLIATFSAWLSYRNVLNRRAEELRETGYRIAEECGTFYQDSSELDENYLPDLTRLATFLGTRIWIMDDDGYIAYDSYDIMTDRLVENFDPTDTSSYYRTGDFFGTFTDEMLTVMTPITANFTTYGYVVIHIPLSDVTEISDSMLLPFYLSFIIIFLLSLVILLIFRHSVYKPLQVITTAANEYAAGNLKYEVSLDSSDEMGYLADTLNFMAHELSEAEDYQKKFIANVSHDFRSPLTSIKGYLEAIVDGVIPPESQEKYLKIVIGETERLTGLTQSMLTLNSLDQNTLKLNPPDFDINQVIKNTCATFEGRCAGRDISFDLIFADFSIYVHADMAKIQQVIYNLVDNAIKFSPDDSTITIEVFDRYEKVFVSVKDQGSGIPKENLKKIWTRFFKSDASRGKDKKGTGLGLSIVKEIIQAHNENIDVISTEGVGTEFIFRLPGGKKPEE